MHSIPIKIIFHHFDRRMAAFRETIDPAHLQVWNDALRCLHSCAYRVKERDIAIALDWSAATERIHRLAAVNFSLEDVSSERTLDELLALSRSVPRNVEIAGTITMNGAATNEKVSERCSLYAIESFAHYIFLAMNLAAPGSIEFYRVKFEFNDVVLESHDVVVSSHHFETAWMDALSGGWPQISAIPVANVCDWLMTVGIGTNQVARTQVQRALFAVLHLCRATQHSPTSVLWVAHGLESLFGTNVGRGFTDLYNRIVLLLQPPPAIQGNLKKQLRAFYELRSKFVHGGMSILHPLENEVFDPAVDKVRSEIGESIDFGTTILVAALQELVRRRCTQLSFREQLVDSPQT